jgi:hypothetical protein
MEENVQYPPFYLNFSRQEFLVGRFQLGRLIPALCYNNSFRRSIFVLLILTYNNNKLYNSTLEFYLILENSS